MSLFIYMQQHKNKRLNCKKLKAIFVECKGLTRITSSAYTYKPYCILTHLMHVIICIKK